MAVYLGAPDPQWLGCSSRPLMVSHNRLRRIRDPFHLPIRDEKDGEWICDSGAYQVIVRHGRYPDTPEEYAAAIRRYDRRIGGLSWAAVQDLPCEPLALRATGASIAEHIEGSVRSYLRLTALWERLDPHRACPFRPVLQGYLPQDYLRCWDRLDRLGVDLTDAAVIGVGSVCGREHTDDIANIVEAVRERRPRRLHGFGVHAEAIDLFDDVDSMSWSAIARWRKLKHPRCTQFHPVCSSCLTWAEAWHEQVAERHTGQAPPLAATSIG